MFKKIFLFSCAVTLFIISVLLFYKPKNILKKTQYLTTDLMNISHSDTDNNLVVNINVKSKEPIKVYVKYSNNKAGKFITKKTDSYLNEHNILLTRLRPLTKYDYRIYAQTKSGEFITTHTQSFTTKDLPPDVKKLKIYLSKGKLSSELLMLSQSETPTSGGYICVDSDGYIVWYNNRVSGGGPIQQRDSSKFIFMTSGLGLNQKAKLTNMQEISADLKILNKISPIFKINKSNIGKKNSIIGQLYMHHDFVMTKNNKIVYLSKMIKDPFFDVGLAKAGKRLQAGDTIREYDLLTKKDTLLFSVFDFINPITDRGQDSNDNYTIPLAEGFWSLLKGNLTLQDWTHCNALSRLNENSNYLLSVRKLNKILSIRPDFKSLDFILGGLNSDFKFEDPSDKFYHQHDVHFTREGTILMFDNGNYRPESEGGQYSRALELKLDYEKMIATKIWQYRHSPDIYCDRVGSVRRLDNGHTIVNFGGDQKSNKFTVVDVDQNNNVHAQLHVEIKKYQTFGIHVLYRAIPLKTISGESKIV